MMPILLSIPHGGEGIPPEVESAYSITKYDLFDDIDPFAVEIYNLGDAVAGAVSAEVARPFVDVNRSLQDMQPENPDGLIKSMTCYKKPIYTRIPDRRLADTLIRRYYMPYHRTIQRSLARLDLQLCLDCHSMAQVAPAIAPDTGRRPAFCLSNVNGQTSSMSMLRMLARCISESFSLDMDQIRYNYPFRGGHITRTYGNRPFPWIQLEMNRGMYLSEEWFDSESLTMRGTRLASLNMMLKDALSSFCRAAGY